MKLSKTICSLAVAAMAGFAGFAHAQWKPSKPIEMIVHTAPGGGNDVLVGSPPGELSPKVTEGFSPAQSPAFCP